MKALTIVLTDGPYISEYAEIAYKVATEALKRYEVNIFLYLDAVHVLKEGQNPASFANIGELFKKLAKDGANIRACMRCAHARGYGSGGLAEYEGIKVAGLYDMAEMISRSDRVISLSR